MTDNPTYDFAGQVALVTGAASGMGLAAARGFAGNGAAVALLDRSAEAVEQASQSLDDDGHRAIGIACDVTDEARVAAAVDQAVETFGRLDMAFNCAGVQAPPSDAADETAANFDQVNAVLRALRRSGSGHARFHRRARLRHRRGRAAARKLGSSVAPRARSTRAGGGATAQDMRPGRVMTTIETEGRRKTTDDHPG